MPRDVDSIADEVLPLDGPYDPEAMALTGRLIGELVRRLNHATMWHNTDESLPYPSGIDTQVAGLVGALNGMGQLLGQLAHRLGTVGQDERLQVDSMGKHMSPPEAAAMAAQCLSEASSGLSVAVAALSDAQTYTARLAWNTGDDD